MSEKSDSAKLQVAAPKPYKKPTLVKGPVLTAVTASTPVHVSGPAAPD